MEDHRGGPSLFGGRRDRMTTTIAWALTAAHGVAAATVVVAKVDDALVEVSAAEVLLHSLRRRDCEEDSGRTGRLDGIAEVVAAAAAKQLLPRQQQQQDRRRNTGSLLRSSHPAKSVVVAGRHCLGIRVAWAAAVVVVVVVGREQHREAKEEGKDAAAQRHHPHFHYDYQLAIKWAPSPRPPPMVRVKLKEKRNKSRKAALFCK